MFKNVPAENK